MFEFIKKITCVCKDFGWCCICPFVDHYSAVSGDPGDTWHCDLCEFPKNWDLEALQKTLSGMKMSLSAEELETLKTIKDECSGCMCCGQCRYCTDDGKEWHCPFAGGPAWWDAEKVCDFLCQVNAKKK